MVSHHGFYQLALLALIWLCVMWPLTGAKPGRPAPPGSATPTRQRSTEPKAFEGVTQKPPGALGAQESGATPPAPPRRPDPMPPPHRRPRTVDTARHCCPHTAGAERGWRGLNHLRAHGPPHGGRWRHGPCPSCAGSVPEHHGTRLHGQHAEVELSGRVRMGGAEGLGRRATARVLAGEAHTGLHGRSEAAAPRRACSASGRWARPGTPCPRAAWSAVLSAVTAGASREGKASKR
jgi:hypothetical protein